MKKLIIGALAALTLGLGVALWPGPIPHRQRP
jgi:hypothetical protein